MIHINVLTYVGVKNIHSSRYVNRSFLLFSFWLATLRPWANAYFTGEVSPTLLEVQTIVISFLTLSLKCLNHASPASFSRPKTILLLTDLEYIGMATCQSSTYIYAQSRESSTTLIFQQKWLSKTVSDELVGEAMFRANVTLALARSSEPHNLLVSFPILQLGCKSSKHAD
jgi:hypothetical protein